VPRVTWPSNLTPREPWEYDFNGFVFLTRDNSQILQVRYDSWTGHWFIHEIMRVSRLIVFKDDSKPTVIPIS
jgi:hypothetical protein